MLLQRSGVCQHESSSTNYPQKGGGQAFSVGDLHLQPGMHSNTLGYGGSPMSNRACAAREGSSPPAETDNNVCPVELEESGVSHDSRDAFHVVTMPSHSMHQPLPNSLDPQSIPVQKTNKKKRKKLKRVVVELDPFVHQRLVKLADAQCRGNLQSLIDSALVANLLGDKEELGSGIRKPGLSKWKRMKFEHLKTGEVEELASAFKMLAKSNTVVEIMSGLLETPFRELTMLQIEKMLEETKKMLLTNERVHCCEECGKQFATPGSLRDHINEHKGDSPYACTFEGCSLQFSSKQFLRRHVKQHECAYKCLVEGCHKRFAFRERLIVHQRTHCDERPLLCPWEGCGKSFKWANSLQGHIRTHTGEKPFQCTFNGCGRLFGYKVDLTRHLRTHYGQPARLNH